MARTCLLLAHRVISLRRAEIGRYRRRMAETGKPFTRQVYGFTA
jgi:hypothetical protein